MQPQIISNKKTTKTIANQVHPLLQLNPPQLVVMTGKLLQPPHPNGLNPNVGMKLLHPHPP